MDFKFRAFHKPRKKMYKVFSFCEEFVKIETDTGYLEKIPINEFEPLMMFIGLKAINNIEIYENDLISLGDDGYNEDGSPNIIEIIFDEETASFRAYDYSGYQGSSLAEKWFMDDIIAVTLVIGNIYENPELLDDKVEGCH